jgi:hypothetical protein|tara:strand:+ start:196 stop:399 length:204 start_codon:yes stop_codon:yes gene_type:complete
VKIGDLVRWNRDNDIGLILGFVQEGASEEDAHEGNPIITWASWGWGVHADYTVRECDEELEVISENR